MARLDRRQAHTGLARSSRRHVFSSFHSDSTLSPLQAEIAEVQKELADKRRELEALDAELKEVKDRVAAAKDAGGDASECICEWP